ncbi:hypothetical protein ACIBG8_08280 [Nonomuraea sp. NPDC050556]|uniref:hypothetical protein n=1 Tax=Nonomuraea sp. NPDC050556 TaxID=3364369 RepID=UPI00378F0CB3
MKDGEHELRDCLINVAAYLAGLAKQEKNVHLHAEHEPAGGIVAAELEEPSRPVAVSARKRNTTANDTPRVQGW